MEQKLEKFYELIHQKIGTNEMKTLLGKAGFTNNEIGEINTLKTYKFAKNHIIAIVNDFNEVDYVLISELPAEEIEALINEKSKTSPPEDWKTADIKELVGDKAEICSQYDNSDKPLDYVFY